MRNIPASVTMYDNTTGKKLAKLLAKAANDHDRIIVNVEHGERPFTVDVTNDGYILSGPDVDGNEVFLKDTKSLQEIVLYLLDQCWRALIPLNLEGWPFPDNNEPVGA